MLWATERGDHWTYSGEKMPGLLPLRDLLFSSDREEIDVCAVNFISLTNNLEAFVMTMISDST